MGFGTCSSLIEHLSKIVTLRFEYLTGEIAHNVERQGLERNRTVVTYVLDVTSVGFWIFNSICSKMEMHGDVLDGSQGFSMLN